MTPEQEKRFAELIKHRTTFGHLEDEDFEPVMLFKGQWDVDNFVKEVECFISSLLKEERARIRKEVNDRDCTTEFNAQYRNEFYESRGFHRANYETIKYIDSLTQDINQTEK